MDRKTGTYAKNARLFKQKKTTDFSNGRSRNEQKETKQKPSIAKKYAEGYKQGVIDGSKNTIDYFSKKLEQLEKQKGIGPKTMQIIVNALGADYFKKGLYKSDF